MRIFLIGYMGSGKSTVGKKLARKLKLDFFDLDELIEKKAGKKIPDIFRDLGENTFRHIEKETLAEILLTDNYVLSTGGGTPCFFNNMELMIENGITLYLRMEAGMLAHRLLHSKTERPLVAGKSKEGLLAFISQNLTEREAFYSQAKFVVNGAELRIEDVVKLIE